MNAKNPLGLPVARFDHRFRSTDLLLFIAERNVPGSPNPQKMADSDRFRIAICSNSLGKSAAGHDILRKLEAAQAHGFDGVEIAVECLEAHAASPSFSKHGSRPSRLRLAAKDIFDKAQSLSLKIVALNPFGAYDGLADPKDVAIRLEEAELWCQLCQILQAPIFQAR